MTTRKQMIANRIECGDAELEQLGTTVLQNTTWLSYGGAWLR